MNITTIHGANHSPLHEASTAGLVVWWRLSENVEVTKLAMLLEEIPFTAPSEPTPEAALKRAMGVLTGTRKLARKIDTKGRKLALVHERADAVAETLDYNVTVNANIDYTDNGDVRLVTTPYTPEVHLAFEAARGVLTCDDIGLWLARHVIPACDGVQLRDTGGIYFIPSFRVDLYKQITSMVKAASKHQFFSAPALKCDDTVEGVLDALSESIATRLERYQQQLESGLGEKALDTKKRQIADTRALVQRYEKLLSTAAEGLHEQIDKLEAHETLTALAQAFGDDAPAAAAP